MREESRQVVLGVWPQVMFEHRSKNRFINYCSRYSFNPLIPPQLESDEAPKLEGLEYFILLAQYLQDADIIWFGENWCNDKICTQIHSLAEHFNIELRYEFVVSMRHE